MKNYLIIILILVLIIFTSLIKTSTRNLETKIFNRKEQIKILSNKKELILLENNFLSSPERLFELKKTLFEDNLITLKFEKFIFLDPNEKSR
tara:strand:+ start:1514 stop:1789 length:276 start_codon:yes stop_codon:yes gene_type:complete